MEILNYLVNLGAAVMMPIIFTIFALVLGVKFGKALKSGLMVGIGFTGLNVIISLLTDNLGPAAEQMVENFGLNLRVLDVGWPAASAIAFGSAIGVLIIPVCIIVNLLMLFTKTTKTINVDIWNYWHFAFTGSMVYLITNDIVVSLIMAAINMIVIMVIADRTAPMVERELGLPGVSIPHAFTGSFAPIAYVLNAIMDKIPGINKIKLDEKEFQKKFGIFGDPAILGTLVGILLGVVAGYDIKGSLNLAIVMAAVLVLTPKMAAVLMEGLMPISETVQEKIQDKFKGNSKLYIGLDSAVGVGNPVTLTISLVMVPLTILLAFIIPGNEFLPFASLAGLPFMFVLIAPLCRGDFFRTLVVGVIIVSGGLLIGTSIAPIFTQAASAANFSVPEGSSLISSIDYGSSWLPFVIVKVAEYKWIGVAVSAVIAVGLMIWNRALITKEDKNEPNLDMKTNEI